MGFFERRVRYLLISWDWTKVRRARATSFRVQLRATGDLPARDGSESRMFGAPLVLTSGLFIHTWSSVAYLS